MVIHGERPFIQALIDGHPTLFIVDTGVLTTIVDTGALDASDASTVSLQIGDLRLPKLPVVQAPVRSYAETYLGQAADGIIGRDLLGRYPVLLDFPNRMMTIFRDSKSAAGTQGAGTVSLALRVIDGQPAVAGSLDGQPARWFSLRTGAGSQAQLTLSQERPSNQNHGERSLPYQEATAQGNVFGLLVRAHSLAIGSLNFSQPLVALLGTTQGGASELAGAFGAMMLSRLSLLIDETSSTAAIVAPPGSTDALLYDPSGITLEMRRETIMVRAVVPGAPADLAHIRPGDEIVSIDGLAPATLDFARQLLDGKPGQKVQIAYRRWHLVHTATLTLHVII